MSFTVRPERAGDVDAIAEIHRSAFGRENEGELVARIRADESFDPALSLVAAEGESPIGHILFSPITIEPHRGDAVLAVALAPMAVAPQWQRRGVGSCLVHAGLAACRRRGHRIVVVVGHAA